MGTRPENAYIEERVKYVAVSAPEVLDVEALSCPA